MNAKFFRKTWLEAVFCLCSCAATISCAGPVSVGMDGNAYVTAGFGGARISADGVRDWKSPDAVVSVYFSVQQPHKNVKLSLKARGDVVYEVSIGGKTFTVPVVSEDFTVVPVGTVDFEKSGYQRVDIRGVSTKERGFGRISEVILEGIDENGMNFVHNFSPYWGRRGPSVHFKYKMPAGIEAEYFYNEMLVPEGMDAIGTFFMACGFGDGYFGAQVNSEKERRVLFSVWSPFESDSPKDVPEEDRVVLKKKGDGVKAGEFGNEGTGGQSYLVYPWTAGTLYKFLTRVRPCDDGTSEYTGFFFAPEEDEWKIIAKFRRPKTQTWVRGPNSFLENFNPEKGWLRRCVGYANQWVRDSSGVWHEMSDAEFTCDSAGRSGVRLDYAGGVSEDKKFFVLMNCGFFDTTTRCYTPVSRDAMKIPPEIDFAALDALAEDDIPEQET